MSARRTFLLGLSALATTLSISPAAVAQDGWPAKTVKLVVPFAAGGTSDILARHLAAQLQISLKQTVIVENKAGAGGVIGADSVAKAPNDGYTLLLGTIATHAINPALSPKMPYDAARDFSPVMLLGSISNVLLVTSSESAKTARELIGKAKAKPGSYAFASAGQGTSQHMSGETLKLLAGIDLLHVPYKGSGPAIQDVIAGQVPMSFETVTVALPHIQAGKVRALAVTSAQRSRALPDVPTLQESGVPGFDVASWQGIFAPAGTPPAIVNRLNSELQKVIAQPETKARMETLGLEYSPNSPKQFAEFQAAEQAKWAKVAKDGNVRLD
ncbi:Bug family tripartite tricarboxylate transporter substrate binding protein [Rhizobacter sp. LjRoot28]|uniref:Bug family tripartite tricarboxylate transporter substrate binding protein n=1 Tax=Rhizobacter sp. LjRoot28 TaxID=3342309 RepID=UPI003ECDF524